MNSKSSPKIKRIKVNWEEIEVSYQSFCRGNIKLILAEELQRRDIIQIHLILTTMEKENSEDSLFSLTTETQRPSTKKLKTDILK